MSGGRVRPRIAVLWNGVTLEELGIADLLKSADLTITTARTNPSKKLPTGKPKVGGASIVFKLPDEAAGQKILYLLYLNARPMLTMGFGYHGEKSYWLGGANIRTRPDMRKFSTVHGYKIDNVTWDYSSQMPTVTLNGMAGRLLGMAEHRRPTIWSGKTLADIARGLSDEHGVTIRISGRVPANQRIAHAVQYAGESRVEFLDRVTRLTGATLHTSTMVASAVAGTTQAYEYVFEGREASDLDDHWVDDQAQIRTVLTIKAIDEEFIDIGTQEQSRPVHIGWAPHLSPAKFGGLQVTSWDSSSRGYADPPDFVALSIKATEENVAKAGPAASKIDKDGTQQVTREEAAKVQEERNRSILDTIKVAFAGRQNEAGVLRLRAEKASKVPKTKVNRVISAVQDEHGGDAMTSAQVQAAVAALGIKTRIVIELNPGAPEISTGVALRVNGTYTHDGIYGSEEVRIVYDETGLKSTITARPVLPGGSDREEVAKVERGAAGARAPGASTSSERSVLDTIHVADQGRINETGVIRLRAEKETKMPKAKGSDEVPAGDLGDLQ